MDSVRREVIGRIAEGLLQLAGAEGAGTAGDTLTVLANMAAAGGSSAVAAAGVASGASDGIAAPSPAAGGDGYMAPWLDTEQCTACDECTRINDRIFAYNSAKKAYIKNPDGGPYRDLVKAAEKCTAGIIHPGLPRDRRDKDIDKWIRRGEKHN